MGETIVTATGSIQGRTAADPAGAATEEGKAPLQEVREPGAFFSRPAPPHSTPPPAPDVELAEVPVGGEPVAAPAPEPAAETPAETSRKAKTAKAGGDE